jgi:hypothetical protein
MLEKFNLVLTNSTQTKAGDKFGYLTVLAVGQIPGTHQYYSVCQCDCGSEPKRIKSASMVAGITQSCGCYQKEQSTTHGLSKNPHYKRWGNMMDRCFNPECHSYADYGGRGITVCEAWRDPAVFISQLPEGFKPGDQLDRINNNGNYEPGNVRWATPKVNSGNRRSCHVLEYKGEALTMTEWSKRTGLVLQTIWERIVVHNWTIERALETPAMSAVERMKAAHQKRWEGHVKKSAPQPMKRYDYKGRSVTMAEMSADCGLPRKLLAKRINERGWTVERATQS